MIKQIFHVEKIRFSIFPSDLVQQKSKKNSLWNLLKKFKKNQSKTLSFELFLSKVQTLQERQKIMYICICVYVNIQKSEIFRKYAKR